MSRRRGTSARKLAGALQGIDSRLVELEHQVVMLRQGAVFSFIKDLVAKLEDGPWGEVLTELLRVDERGAFDGDPGPLVDQLRILRPALLQALGIRPYPPQRRVWLSLARVQEWRWAGDAPPPEGKRCCYEVVSPGWKRGEQVLLTPRIRPARVRKVNS